MRHGEDSKLLCGDLINDAIREATENASSARATKHGTEQRIALYEIGRSFKLGYKSEAKLNIRFQRIKRPSRSSASADGVTTSFTSVRHEPEQERQQSG
jgi:hypothetical protein